MLVLGVVRCGMVWVLDEMVLLTVVGGRWQWRGGGVCGGVRAVCVRGRRPA